MPEQTQEQEQSLNAPILATEYLVASPLDEAEISERLGNPTVSHPWDGDQAFIDLVTALIPSCPGSYSGDYGFFTWLYKFYGQAQGTTPKAAPTITALNPSTSASGAQVQIDITGTGFDPGALVNFGTAHSIPPMSVTPTDLVVLIEAINIAAPGTLAVSVENSDSQVSNAMDFTAT
jgi:hypothetical protein